MQSIFDLLNNIVNSFRWIVALILFCTTGFGLIMTFGFSYAAPEAIGEMAEKAAEAKERETQAKLDYKREEALAEEGWGSSADGDFADPDNARGGRKDHWSSN
ncbi:MAG: hypothetical protein AAGK17_04265 [Pseudomonadota bacterium]